MKMRDGLVAEVSVSQTEILASGSRKFLLYEHSSLVTKTKMILWKCMLERKILKFYYLSFNFRQQIISLDRQNKGIFTLL